MKKLSTSWNCCLNGMFISATGLRPDARVSRSPVQRNVKPHFHWFQRNLNIGFVDDGKFAAGTSYTYSASRFTTSDPATKVVPCTCPRTACSFLNLSFFPSISKAPENDQSISWGEYQLLVPRYAAVNLYVEDDANVSIQNGRWLHAYTLPPPDGDTRGQAIGAWLFQSSPSILSVIARERLLQGRNDILVGYQIVLDRPLEEREEGDVGETVKEVDVEVKVVEVAVKEVEVKVVEVELDAESGEEEAKESIMSRPDGGKHERVWVGPVRLVADTGPIDGVTGSAAFLLTNFDEGDLFHLLVPCTDEVSHKAVIKHYTQEESILGQWTYVATLQPPSDDPETKFTAVTFVQSSQGKFEAVARVTPPNEKYSYLVGYELDAVNHQKEWSPPFGLVADTGPIDKVTGSPTIIESDFGEEDRFHLLVPQDTVTVQYTLALGSFRDGQWKSFAKLNPFQNLPVTAVSLVENQVGRFEAVTRVQRPQGDELVIGYELKPGTTQWSDGIALNADDGPILAGKPTPPVDEPPTNPIG